MLLKLCLLANQLRPQSHAWWCGSKDLGFYFIDALASVGTNPDLVAARLVWAVLVHWGLNLIHLLLFTYPMV
ncbi:hypothetical protein [Halomonas sp. H5]|uniref:hypothetical protein n=1 Tax=Halomonas sp. H5 TaxID=3423910 RepID=UPI003D36FB9C